ncbi:hypothetical protein [Sinorhizobium chiapasense]|uniref:Uncharacterized protein n=1 Tax=Sinorhizobium chiapasense TaxID=501572 RepID=A0ABZ2BL15_9HYPH
MSDAEPLVGDVSRPEVIVGPVAIRLEEGASAARRTAGHQRSLHDGKESTPTPAVFKSHLADRVGKRGVHAFEPTLVAYFELRDQRKLASANCNSSNCVGKRSDRNTIGAASLVSGDVRPLLLEVPGHQSVEIA